MKHLMFFYFSVVFILLMYSKQVKSEVGMNRVCESSTDPHHHLHRATPNIKINNIGAILDLSSRKGKEEKVAMEMAIDDFNKNYTNNSCSGSSQLVLHIRGDYLSSQNNIASLAMDLIDEKRVRAILGGWKWDDTTTVAELGHKYQVPVLSLSEGVPYWASHKWTFLVQAVRSQYLQTRAVAAIVGSWKWSRVNFIYEEGISSVTNFVPHLVDALAEVDCKIDHLLPLPSVNLAHYSSSLFTKELEKLKGGQSRIFIVHSSLLVASHLFMVAKSMGLMGKDSVWITTNALTNLLDSVNQSTISSMQGVLGVMSYFPKDGENFNEFSSTFQNRFHLEFPDEVNLVPGIFATQAYDALWAVALAMEQRKTNKKTVGNSPNDKMLLERILVSNFMGLTGQFRFKEYGRLGAAHIFQLVNVVGKSYREMGFWSEGLGFSENISEGEEEVTYNTSMKILGNVYWPGGPHSIPRGWVLLRTGKTLRIGVPAKPTFSQFVNVRYHPGGNFSVDGLSIDVFTAVHQNLQYPFPYHFIPYTGTYDSLVKQIHLKKFDAVIGDTSIVADRCEYAEFSQPWTETGLQMVVFTKSKSSKRAWLFMKPFTKAMWGVTALINIYNGFVVWSIERMYKPEFKGSALTQIGILIWLSFTTLFCLQGDGMHSNLSRMTMVAWLFVALVITQSYTANLSSMLTVPQLEPSWVSVESLKQSNAKVGCDGGSFVVKYLENVLGFNPDNIQTIASDDQYPQALKRGEIKAAFLVVPYVKVFLAKYCKDFAVVGPTYNVGGFGFAFPKGSPLLPGISKSILQLAESGKLLKLQNALLSSYNCSRSDDDHDSLGVTSYWGLFVFTGGTSTVALVLFFIQSIFKKPSHDPLIHGTEVTETENKNENENENEEHEQLIQSDNDLIPEGTEEHQVHNPDFDELWMFAPEMHG